MTGRAKWDAWNTASKTYGQQADDAEARYVAIARDLGWSEDKPLECEGEDQGEIELDSDDEEEARPSGSGGGSGLGVAVSMMSASQEQSGSVLSDLAIAGDVQGLRALLDANTGVDVNAKDENVSSRYASMTQAVLNRVRLRVTLHCTLRAIEGMQTWCASC